MYILTLITPILISLSNVTPSLECEAQIKLYDNNPFCIQYADNEEERRHGLMFQYNIPLNYGMLFDFNYPQIIKMWMRNTPTSLHMIFMDEDYCVTHIQESTTPLSDEIITTTKLSRYVLEISHKNNLINIIELGKCYKELEKSQPG